MLCQLVTNLSGWYSASVQVIDVGFFVASFVACVDAGVVDSNANAEDVVDGLRLLVCAIRNVLE